MIYFFIVALLPSTAVIINFDFQTCATDVLLVLRTSKRIHEYGAQCDRSLKLK